jgi:NTP pyrophosphatase (non-canonical NTP hydrolase)
MTFEEYEKCALALAIYPDKGLDWRHAVVGLAGETGEVADKAKKIMRDNGGVLNDANRTAIVKELGDVLWYVTALAAEMGSSLGEVAKGNLDKCEGRSRRGTLQGAGDDR